MADQDFKIKNGLQVGNGVTVINATGDWVGNTIPVAEGGTGVTTSTGTGSVVLSASPTFTGAPLATTAAADTNTTQVATTAFVVGQASSSNPVMDGTAAVGTSLKYARADHVHASDTSRAPLASPTFTGTVTLPADPTAALQAATKQYVDNLVQGLDIKPSVKVASTANLILSASQTIDGIVVVAGDRVLVKNQTTASQNGIYVVAAGSWTAAADVASSSLGEGAFVWVEQGTTNGDTGWVLTDAATEAWTQFTGVGQIVAGAGLTKTAPNQLDVAGTADRITVNADSIDIANTYVGQNTITTLGTVATGTWNATTIATNKGGTGLTSFTANGIVYASSASALTTTAGTAGQILLANASAVPTWSSTVGSGITWNGSVVGLTYGGTGANLTAANGGVVYSGASALAVTAAGTAGQVLQSSGAAAPSWATLDLTDLPGVWVKQTVKVASTANIAGSLASNVFTVTATGVLTVDGVTTALNDRVLLKDQTTGAQNGIYYVSTAGATGVSAVLTRVADADTAAELAGATVAVDQGTANAGRVYTNSFKSTDTLGTTSVSFYRVIDSSVTIPVTTGGTGTTTAPTAGGIIYGASTSAYGSTGAGTSGQLLVSAGAAVPVWTSTSSMSPTFLSATLSAQYGVGNDVQRQLVLSRATSAAAANGIGAGISFNVEDAGGTTAARSYIDSVLNDVTSGYVDSYLAFSTSANNAIVERMRVGYNGNVGIGTSTPSEKLDVSNGNIRTVGGSSPQVYVGSTTSDGLFIRHDTVTSADYFDSVIGGVEIPVIKSSRDSTSGALQLRPPGTSGEVQVFTGRSGTDYLYVSSTGLVGYWSPAGGNTAWRLDPNGGISGTSIAWIGQIKPRRSDNIIDVRVDSNNYGTLVGNLSNASDARLKTRISPTAYGLEAIKQLKPSTFAYTSNPENLHLGLIAQEVEEILPEVITNSAGTLGVEFSGVTAVLINAVKELSAQVDELKAKMAAHGIE